MREKASRNKTLPAAKEVVINQYPKLFTKGRPVFESFPNFNNVDGLNTKNNTRIEPNENFEKWEDVKAYVKDKKASKEFDETAKSDTHYKPLERPQDQAKEKTIDPHRLYDHDDIIKDLIFYGLDEIALLFDKFYEKPVNQGPFRISALVERADQYIKYIGQLVEKVLTEITLNNPSYPVLLWNQISKKCCAKTWKDFLKQAHVKTPTQIRGITLPIAARKFRQAYEFRSKDYSVILENTEKRNRGNPRIP